MAQNWNKLIRGNRLNEEESEWVAKQVTMLTSGIQDMHSIQVQELSPVFSKLLLHGLSKDGKDEALAFANWMQSPDAEHVWSPALEALAEPFFLELQTRRIGGMLERINDKVSLTQAHSADELISSLNRGELKGLYNNKVPELNIDFDVFVLPFPMEVMDPRIVIVKPGATNELHRHAHETVFIFLKGHGKVLVDQFENEVHPGDFAFIPRWCNHQSVNLGQDDLVFLAVADFGLTGKSFMGNYLKTARMKHA
ncbi:MAG: cupin domain-containing protein [Flavobacteriales bacterium]